MCIISVDSVTFYFYNFLLLEIIVRLDCVLSLYMYNQIVEC